MSLYVSAVLELGTRWKLDSSYTPDKYTSRKRAIGTEFVGGCVGPRSDREAVGLRKIPFSSKRLPILSRPYIS
jgi:hypothetical protein